MVQLVPMSPDRLTEWLPRCWDDYRRDLLRAGLSAGAAEKNISQNASTLFDGVTPRAGQHLFDAVDDGALVGVLWLAQVDEGASGEWFVYNVEVDESVRGRGYGRAIMSAAEDFSIAHGGTSLSLNVFGFNDVARGLYHSMGYDEVAISMKKRLD